jgi:osmotically-inducible protein OsmY
MATTMTRSRPFLRNWPGSQASSPGISVSARAGIVTLPGRVESYPQKQAAEMATGRVTSVKAIAEAIVVTLPLETRRTDEELATAAIGWPAGDVSVLSDAIKARVADGWTTLTGQVDWFYQKEVAVQDLQRLLGVVGVSNEVTIRSRIDASGISDDTTHALNRSWFFDAQTIPVTTEVAKVRLVGTPTPRTTGRSPRWRPGLRPLWSAISPSLRSAARHRGVS